MNLNVFVTSTVDPQLGNSRYDGNLFKILEKLSPTLSNSCMYLLVVFSFNETSIQQNTFYIHLLQICVVFSSMLNA